MTYISSFLFLIYVRHTVTSRITNFAIYQSCETAASAPWAKHVMPYVTYMSSFLCCHLSIMFVIGSCRAISFLAHIKKAKQPRAHNEHDILTWQRPSSFSPHVFVFFKRCILMDLNHAVHDIHLMIFMLLLEGKKMAFKGSFFFVRHKINEN